MPEGNVKIKVKAEVEGKGELGSAKDGMKQYGEATDQASEKTKIFHLRSIASFQALSNLRAGLSGVIFGFRQLGLGNEAVNAALEKFHALMMLTVGIMQVAAAAKILLTAATWGHVAAMIAEHGFLAPVVLGVIAAALAGLIALKAAHMMASGGEGVVTKPTLFMAGEAGPEAFSFRPLGGGSISNNSTSNMPINITVNSKKDQDLANEIGWEIRKSIQQSGGNYA